MCEALAASLLEALSGAAFAGPDPDVSRCKKALRRFLRCTDAFPIRKEDDCHLDHSPISLACKTNVPHLVRTVFSAFSNTDALVQMTRPGGNNIFHVLAVYDWDLRIFEELTRLMLGFSREALLRHLLGARNARGFTPVGILNDICLAGEKGGDSPFTKDVFQNYEDAVAKKVFGRCEYGRKTAIFAPHAEDSVLLRRNLIREKYHFEDVRLHRPFSLEHNILLAAGVAAATGNSPAASRSGVLWAARLSPSRADSSPSGARRKTRTKRSRSRSRSRDRRPQSLRNPQRSPRARRRSREQPSSGGPSEEGSTLSDLVAAGLITTDLASLVRKGEMSLDQAAALSLPEYDPFRG